MPNNAKIIARLSESVYGLTAEITPIKIPTIEEIIKAETASNAVAGNVSRIVFKTSRFEE
jgi:hypothetical protein